MGKVARRLAVFFSAAVLLVVIVGAVFAPLFTRYSYDYQESGRAPAGSTASHPLGTDHLGRDVLSRMLYGARVSLFVGVGVEAVTLTCGLLIGLFAGYRGGRVDALLMRFTDAMFAFPDILLAILIIGVLGPGLLSVFAALTVVGWPAVARLVRGQVISLKEREFVLATRSLGASGGHILFRHILPHLGGTLLAYATVDIASVILAESSLSFLGIGVQPPHPSWGAMINAATGWLRTAPMLIVVPCVALSLTVLGLNFLGDSLRERWDPYQRGRTAN